MEERKEIVTLIDEDGAKLDFLVLDYFDVEELTMYSNALDQDRTDRDEVNYCWTMKMQR